MPESILALVKDAARHQVDGGKSGASVFRFDTDSGVLFLKTSQKETSELAEEAARLRWLERRAIVPEVLAFEQDDRCDYLLVTALAGIDGVAAAGAHPEAITIGLARALKELHAQPIDGCPFDQSVGSQVARARVRLEAGLVDETDFDEERLGRSAEELFGELQAWRPASEGRVLTHGDPCLPNVIFDNGRFTGFIDCGRAGVADPCQDLALAARSIESNLGTAWLTVFFREYGVPSPDERKLAFYRLLDEFF